MRMGALAARPPSGYASLVKAELDRETILAALGRLNEMLREQSVLGEICLLGGTVLAHRLGLASADEAFEVVTRYYPAERIPARTQFLLEDIFSSLEGSP